MLSSQTRRLFAHWNFDKTLMNLLSVAALRVNDQIRNVGGEIGTVVAVNPTPSVNAVAVAWEKSGIWLYNRGDSFPGVTIYSLSPSKLSGTPILPADMLASLYPVPDPTNWLVQSLLAWRAHRAALSHVAENGIETPEDKRLAWHAVKYVSTVLDKMRGAVIDWTQN